jgi:hypothetical protein
VWYDKLRGCRSFSTGWQHVLLNSASSIDRQSLRQ